MSDRKIRVLIVDDSAMIRKVLSVGLSNDPDIQVLGTASGAEMARRFMDRRPPDVITLDLEMPHMDGLSFLRSYMPETPIPTVVISSQTQRGQKVTMEAFDAGAVDVIAKPQIEPTQGLGNMMQNIVQAVKAAARARVGRVPADKHHFAAKREIVRPKLTPAPMRQDDWLIALGSSTGGVQALAEILPELPKETPPVVVVQHMPEGFTRSFASRLDSISQVTVKEAEHNETLSPGTVYIAPGGDKHMTLHRRLGGYVIKMIDGDPVCFSRPAVDVLFNSIAEISNGKVSAGLLTGMGRDGSEGLLNIKQSGGFTFAQDEKTCVVFGMPWAAENIGATKLLVPLPDIPNVILNSIGRLASGSGKGFARTALSKPLGVK